MTRNGSKSRHKQQKRRYTNVTSYYKKKAGLPPGTLTPGDDSAVPSQGQPLIPTIRLVHYNKTGWTSQEIEPTREGVDLVISTLKTATSEQKERSGSSPASPGLTGTNLQEPISPNQQGGGAYGQKGVVWVHIAGNLTDELFQYLGSQMDIDTLTLEDIASNHQRPKIEFSANHVYMAFTALAYNGQEFVQDQGDFILGKGYLLSFSNGFGLPAGSVGGANAVGNGGAASTGATGQGGMIAAGGHLGSPGGLGPGATRLDNSTGYQQTQRTQAPPPAQPQNDLQQVPGQAVPFEDWTQPVYDRIASGRGFVRQNGPDYLCYAMLDTIVDRFFAALEAWEIGNEEVENRLLFRKSSQGGGEGGSDIHALRGQKESINQVRRIVWPTRELLTEVLKNESKSFFPTAQRYFKDIYDHVLILQDLLETMRDSVGDLMTLHLSVVSNRLNEIMKVLTILSAIFIPITFIAGLYGMNFVFMPELRQPWAYPAVLGVMAGLVGGMIIFFKRKGWF